MTSSNGGLRLEGVSKAFEDRVVLQDVDLAVPPGSVCSLVGSNGAGKSTLLNLCLGYITPDRGRILIGGSDLGIDPIAARMKTACVPDIARLYPHLSAVENLTYFESLRGVRVTRAQCLAALDRLGFPVDSADRPARSYSKGTRQKVSLAMGVLKEADIFLLDEPSSGLDASSTGEFLKTIRHIADQGKAVLFSTHHRELVDRVVDVVAHLQDGRVAFDVSPRSSSGNRGDDECAAE
jgi:ABC-2 type transport system ATP-binding protein